MIDAHPALKAASPQAPIVDWFVGDDLHHNGALLPAARLQLHRRLRPAAARADARSPTAASTTARPTATTSSCDWARWPTPTRSTSRATSPFWNEVMQHGTYDEFWKARNLRPHLKNIKPAVMTVGGWFDAENLFGALETYQHVEANSPGSAQRPGDGPVGPRRLEPRRRRHARRRPLQRQDGRVLPRADRAAVLRVPPQGQGRAEASRGAGSSRPARTSGASTTPGRRKDAKPQVALLPRRRPTGRRAAGRRPAEDGFDEYVSDPAKPVPFIDKIGIGMSPEYMVADQRFAARRPDVLVYQTDVAGRRT